MFGRVQGGEQSYVINPPKLPKIRAASPTKPNAPTRPANHPHSTHCQVLTARNSCRDYPHTTRPAHRTATNTAPQLPSQQLQARDTTPASRPPTARARRNVEPDGQMARGAGAHHLPRQPHHPRPARLQRIDTPRPPLPDAHVPRRRVGRLAAVPHLQAQEGEGCGRCWSGGRRGRG
jgi:hypothetical protein